MRMLLALLLVLCLTACAPASVPAEEVPAPPEAAEPPAPEVLHFEVDTGVWTDSASAEDGTLLAEYRFLLPELKVCRDDGTEVTEGEMEAAREALAVAERFNEKFGKWAAAEEFPEYVRNAEADLELRREYGGTWIPYALELGCSIYQTERIISVSGVYYSNTGGAHPNTYLLGWNFDLDTGEFFDPKTMSDGTALMDYVTEELTAQARARASEAGMQPEEMYWEDYETILADWGSYAVSFNEAGMQVAFSPYELAAYAAGAQEFQISYEALAPHLNGRGRLMLGLDGE